MGAHSELLPVVGIGASAGGLAALKKLFGYMPADTGMAFVVVIHLSPEHESHLADLLQAHSPMPVTQVTGTMEMRPDHIYVIPPGANLTAVDTHLRLSKLEKQRGQRAPIDHFFGTLAETHHQTAVGVILTGTGSDGTSGLRRIREMGGLAIVQDPGEAEYDSMPRSAIDKGIVDLVLPLSEMPAYIVRFATTQPDVPVPEGDGDIERDERQTLVNILTQVRARTGHDFTRYKPATVMRRIRRRMQIHEIEELEQYAERIRPDRVEAQHLFDDLLITVTNFFRDQGTFEALERHIIPQLMSGKGNGDRIRAWSVGCATGEEAYSLAMLLMEQAAQMDCTPEIQVFATDIHQASLQSAREGLYPGTIESDVTPERLRRFFVRENDHYRIRAEVRERIVFAPHNLMKDPPFSQLDLISCRNLLIYLQREVQQGIFRLFHYALRPGRYLLLGSSETVERSELFDRVEEAHCIYRRRDIPAKEARLPIFPVPAARLARQDPDLPRRPEGVPGYGALHQKMVELYAPPSVLVNEDDAIVHSSARAGRYLEVPGGEPTNNVFRLAREPLRLELRSGLSAARERREAYHSRPIRLEVEGGQVHVMVRVQPAGDDGELSRLYLVIFDEVPAPKPVERGSDAATEGTVRELEAEGTVRELQEELAATRARLQAGIEEHGSSQEEMQASNEELQSMNEELRSTMEELETSKEELQSINEELATVNQENRHKVEELGQLSSDLQNLFSATDIATLFLDRQLRIMRFTPPLGELFNVRSTDRGRPISDLTHHLGAIALEKDTQEVLDSLVPVTREVRSQEGRWYLSRILPYRSTEDRIDGVVITFIDITERRDAEAAVRQSEERQAFLLELSDALRPLSDRVAVQAAAVETLGRHLGAVRAQYWEAEAHGEHLISHGGYFNGTPPINGRARMDEFGAHLQAALTFGQTLSVADAADDPHVGEEERAAHEAFGFRAYVAVPLVKDGQLVATLGVYHADAHEWTNQEISLIEATAERTWAAVERARAEETLSESEERFRTVSNLVPDLLWRSDPTGSTTWYNQRWMEYTGQTLEEALGWGWIDVIHPDDREQAEKNYRRATEEAESLEQAYRIRRHDGEYRWFLVRAEPLLDAEREVRHFFGSATDVHDQRTTLEELEARVKERTHEVRELARTLTMAEQEERRRIARILHDDLQQLLFGVQLRLDHLARDTGEPPRPKLKKDLQEARDWIGSAIAHTRELSLELSPPVLKEEGLAKALGWLAGQMWEKHQFKVDLRAEEGTRINDEDARSLLFQTARELLFNVLKHAGVREAAAAIWAEDEHIHLEISDAGSGFNLEALQAPPGPQTGLGLSSARERIGLIGGSLEIDTAPGEGTRIRITVPMHTTRRSQT